MGKDFDAGGVNIRRQTLTTAMTDSATLRSFHYRRQTSRSAKQRKAAALQPALLCLPDELSLAVEHEKFVLEFLASPLNTADAHIVEMRGRGGSETGKSESGVSSDADDLVSFCDARNLHHVDVVVSGRSIFPLLLALVKRPGLVRRLVLNDAAPEFDTVGIARETAALKRAGSAGSFDEAAKNLKTRFEDSFPSFDDDDWSDRARTRWQERGGTLEPAHDKSIVRLSNNVDYDARQPSVWEEFAMLKASPILLVKGEHSPLVTDEICAKVEAAHPSLKITIARGQGHVPALHKGELVKEVTAFLE